MAEKFFVIIAVVLNMIMLTILCIELTRLAIIPIVIYTIMTALTIGILIVAIDEYREAVQSRTKQQDK